MLLSIVDSLQIIHVETGLSSDVAPNDQFCGKKIDLKQITPIVFVWKENRIPLLFSDIRSIHK